MHDIAYEETFASTLRLDSLRMLLAFAAYFDFEIAQMNVPDIYLKGELNEVIYMKVLQGSHTTTGSHFALVEALVWVKTVRSRVECKS